MSYAHAHARTFFYLAPVSLVRELINSFLMDFSIPPLGLDVLHAYTQSVSLSSSYSFLWQRSKQSAHRDPKVRRSPSSARLERIVFVSLCTLNGRTQAIKEISIASETAVTALLLDHWFLIQQHSPFLCKHHAAAHLPVRPMPPLEP